MTMRSLSLSIYPDHTNFEDNTKYLELGHKLRLYSYFYEYA